MNKDDIKMLIWLFIASIVAIIIGNYFYTLKKEKIVTIHDTVTNTVYVEIPVEKIVYQDRYITVASGSSQAVIAASMATLPTSTASASGTVTQDGITIFYQCNASSTPVIVSKDDKILAASNTMTVQGTASASGKVRTVDGGAWWDKMWVGGVVVLGLILIL